MPLIFKQTICNILQQLFTGHSMQELVMVKKASSAQILSAASYDTELMGAAFIEL